LPALPPPIDEGTFAFFRESEIYSLNIPESDRKALWPFYFEKRSDFTVLRADCHPGHEMDITVEEFMPVQTD